jgi:predicted DCC family thiol-disulfide oxidoreductase YuxK
MRCDTGNRPAVIDDGHERHTSRPSSELAIMDTRIGDRIDPNGPAIILFDAVCVLCSWNAKFILKHDTQRRFRLAAMQGTVGAELYRRHGMDPTDPVSILVFEYGRVHRDSDAVLAIYRGLGPPWSWIGVARWIPKALRDPVYLAIARHRYRLFGKRQTCWMPAPEDRDRLL